MSFLYQALLKNNQQAGPQQGTEQGALNRGDTGLPSSSGHQASSNQGFVPAGFSQPGMFAPESKPGVPVAMWMTLAVALLIIGLLAGYIVGDKQQANLVPGVALQASGANPIESNNVATAKGTTIAEIENEPEPKLQLNAKNAPAETESAQTSQTPEPPASPQNAIGAEPRVEVALSDEGKVITRVSDKLSSVDEQVQSRSSDSEPSSRQEESLLESEAESAIDLNDIPDALKQQFAQAVEATQQITDASEFQPTVSSQSSLSMIEELTETERAGLPEIEYQMHIYASDVTERWVKLNGRVFTQGEEFMPGLKLLEIRQDMIVWETTYDRFAQEALVDFRHN